MDDWGVGSTLRQSRADFTATLNFFGRRSDAQGGASLSGRRDFSVSLDSLLPTHMAWHDPRDADRARLILDEMIAESGIREDPVPPPLPSELVERSRVTAKTTGASTVALTAPAVQQGEPARLAIRLAVTSIVLGLAIYAILSRDGVDPAWGGIGAVVGYWLR